VFRNMASEGAHPAFRPGRYSLTSRTPSGLLRFNWRGIRTGDLATSSA
jgi:hypothetical protein